jgi:flagellar biosynthesis/type III secretory pathway protein FliH
VSATDRLPIRGRLVGLRLHPRAPAPGSPAEPRVRWLLQLGERGRRDEAEHRALLAVAEAVQQALADLPILVQARLDQVAALAVGIGLAVAREVVGTALERGAVDPTPMVERCLREAVAGSNGAPLRIWLHPQDLAPVLERLANRPDLQPALAQAELVADPGLGRGAVRAETGAGCLRWDPIQALERISAEVRAEAGT